MSRFKVGQVVKIKGRKNKALVIGECKEPTEHLFLILLPVDTSVELVCLHEQDITSYRNFCWNCKTKYLDSDKHQTCPNCGWIICPSCGKCSPECLPHRIRIYPADEVDDGFIVISDKEFWKLMNGG